MKKNITLAEKYPDSEPWAAMCVSRTASSPAGE